ncbi:MAG: hypothetical protein JW727_04075 [Candidatus Aenigmarchaeota archaeon]|nr:hypothetical protein [Candidatus Aenigmarchaeota archaeon]
MKEKKIEGILAPAYLVGHTFTVEPRENLLTREDGCEIYVRTNLPQHSDELNFDSYAGVVYFSEIPGEEEWRDPVRNLKSIEEQMVMCAVGNPRDRVWKDLTDHAFGHPDSRSVSKLRRGVYGPTRSSKTFEEIYLMTSKDIYQLGNRKICSGGPKCSPGFGGYDYLASFRCEGLLKKQIDHRKTVLGAIKGYAKSRGFAGEIPIIEGEIRKLNEFASEKLPE